MSTDPISRLVETERHGPVLLVRMTRESKRNAINSQMAWEIDAALSLLDNDDGLLVGILTGTASVFSAGTDMYDTDKRTPPSGGEYGVIRRVRRKPLIAAVEGPAVGGGLEIVMSCDLVVASESATFALPETRRGLVATSGALFRGPRSLPRNLAAELLLTGGSLDAARAFTVGFVNRVVERGTAVAAAVELAKQICLSSPSAIAETLTALHDLVEEHDAAGWEVTSRARDAVLASPDAVEGRRAFAEKRSPQWVTR
jgi:enoyl-CoA hydratase